MKNLFLIGCLSFFTFAAFGQRTIHVEDNKIYTACDEEIVMRGVNEMFIWSPDRTGVTTLPEIAKTGSNTVRLVWTTDGSPAELDQLIANCLANDMIPVPELHDATGDFSQFQKLVDYWKRPEVLAIVQKYKQWIIVNIGNEVGSGAETNEQWEAYYEDAITQLRDAGIDVPLMIDCGNYGSNEEYFLSKGNNLMEHDPLHNLIFSVHTYWISPNSDQGRMDRLDDLISEAKTKNLPFIIGEGPQLAASPWDGDGGPINYCEVEFPYEYLLQRCEEEGIGWLAWSWGLVNNNDCGSPNSVFDITTDGKFGNWSSDFGEEIMITDANSAQNTSVIPASLLNGSCGTAICTPVAIAASTKNICVNGSAEISILDDAFLTSNHSIKWFFNNSEIPNADKSTYTATEAGTYRIEVDSLGLCTVFDDIQINGTITVDLGEDQRICTSETVQLSIEKEEPSYSVSWFQDNQELINSENENTLTVDKAGEYVAVVSSDYCEGSDTVQVTGSLPDVDDTVICSGTEETLTVNGNGNYVWYADEALTQKLHTGSSYTVNQDQAETYFIRDESGFEGTVGKAALEDSFWDTWDAESKTNKLGFEVFETVTIKTFDVYAQSAGAMNVVFYNASLTEIETLSFTASAGKNTLTINKTFAPGVYYADVAGSSINLRFNHDERDYTTNYPYVLQNGGQTILSIDRSSPDWAVTKPWYLFFYNWRVAQESGAECIAVDMQVDVKTGPECVTSLNGNLNEKSLTVYPNPTDGMLNLSQTAHWKLYSINGGFIKEGNGTRINLWDLDKGLYLLQTDEKQFKIEKR